MGSRLLLCLALISFGAIVHAGGFGDRENIPFLPADQAFVPDAWIEGEQATVSWRIAPGYYLYGHALRFEIDGEAVTPSVPRGEPYVDEHFGEVSIYRDQLFVTLPASAEHRSLTVHYQGCADAGLCYPPTQQTFQLAH